jgi:quercetin dioxygenase-like cupin family protein
MTDALRSPLILQAGEGRRTQTGVDRVVKADASLTNGRISIAHVTQEAGFSPRAHRHTRHDEMFFVLTGGYMFRVGEQNTAVGAGGFVFVPRGTDHSFLCEDGGSMLVMFSPADMEDYFAEVADMHENGTYSRESAAALQTKYGMELVGDEGS